MDRARLLTAVVAAIQLGAIDCARRPPTDAALPAATAAGEDDAPAPSDEPLDARIDASDAAMDALALVSVDASRPPSTPPGPSAIGAPAVLRTPSICGPSVSYSISAAPSARPAKIVRTPKK